MKKKKGTTGMRYVKMRCMGDHHHQSRVVTKGDRITNVVFMRDDGVRCVSSKILILLVGTCSHVLDLHERISLLNTAPKDLSGTVVIKMMKAQVENPQLLLIPIGISRGLGRINRLLHVRDMLTLCDNGLPGLEIRIQICEEELDRRLPLVTHALVEDTLEDGRRTARAGACVDKVVVARVSGKVGGDDVAYLSGS